MCTSFLKKIFQWGKHFLLFLTPFIGWAPLHATLSPSKANEEKKKEEAEIEKERANFWEALEKNGDNTTKTEKKIEKILQKHPEFLLAPPSEDYIKKSKQGVNKQTTPLHFAAHHGNENILTLLLEAERYRNILDGYKGFQYQEDNFSLNKKDTKGNTPLMAAIMGAKHVKQSIQDPKEKKAHLMRYQSIVSKIVAESWWGSSSEDTINKAKEFAKKNDLPQFLKMLTTEEEKQKKTNYKALVRAIRKNKSAPFKKIFQKLGEKEKKASITPLLSLAFSKGNTAIVDILLKEVDDSTKMQPSPFDLFFLHCSDLITLELRFLWDPELKELEKQYIIFDKLLQKTQNLREIQKTHKEYKNNFYASAKDKKIQTFF